MKVGRQGVLVITCLMLAACFDLGGPAGDSTQPPPTDSEQRESVEAAHEAKADVASQDAGISGAAVSSENDSRESDVSTKNAESGSGGLTWTPAELAVWRDRSRVGPYRTKGDAGTNTPGDWERIDRNARDFARDPGASHLVANFSGCATPSNMGRDDRFGSDLRGAGGKFERSVELRDAAFKALVKDDKDLARKVIDQLVRQAEEPTLDFTNRRKWCPADTNADAFEETEFLFPLGSYLARLLFAYDYVTRWASADERALLDRWHQGAATYMRSSLYRSDRLWKDAEAGDYRPTRSAGYQYPQWRGGRDTSRYGRHYNNRQAVNVLYVTAAGVKLADESLTKAGRRWAKEYVRYSAYPDGTVAELERGRSGAERGMNYVNKTLSTVAMIADVLARDGDPSVYEYATSDGIFGTSGGSKTLESAMKAVSRMYNTSGRIATGGGDYAETDRRLASDAAFAVGQRFLDDPTVERLLDRSWPNDPRHSWAEPWQGPWGLLPGALFQYHDLGAPGGDPYPSAS